MGAVLMAHDAKRIRVALFYPCDKAIYDGGDDPHSSSPSTSGPRPASISAIRDFMRNRSAPQTTSPRIVAKHAMIALFQNCCERTILPSRDAIWTLPR